MPAEYLNTTLGDLARDIPGATAVFHAHRLDFCCQGNRTLADAAAKKGIPVDAVVAQLEALAPAGPTARDWQHAPVGELVEHILQRFHARHREQLPELIRLARRVEQVHGDRPHCPNGLADHLCYMAQEMESHMLKEEQVLFPLLLQGRRGLVSGPISVMRFEHEQHGAALDEIVRLTDDITPPENACNTWQALYRGLEELRQDLTQHIHLENNILFADSPPTGDAACRATA